MARSGGPGSFVFGDEERKEVMDVLEGRYLFRYGAAVLKATPTRLLTLKMS